MLFLRIFCFLCGTFYTLSHDLCLTGFGGKNIPLNTSKPNSDLTEQLVRSTFVSPQLEANSVIPARQTPFR